MLNLSSCVYWDPYFFWVLCAQFICPLINWIVLFLFFFFISVCWLFKVVSLWYSSIHAYTVLRSNLLPLLLSSPSPLFKTIFNEFNYSIFIPPTLFAFTLSLRCTPRPFCTPVILCCCCCCFRSRFRTQESTWAICLSQSGLFHLTWWVPVSSIPCKFHFMLRWEKN
jgi:hypothetical protein